MKVKGKEMVPLPAKKKKASLMTETRTEAHEVEVGTRIARWHTIKGHPVTVIGTRGPEVFPGRKGSPIRLLGEHGETIDYVRPTDPVEIQH